MSEKPDVQVNSYGNQHDSYKFGVFALKVTAQYLFYSMHALAQQHLTFQDEWTVPESSVMEVHVQYGSRVYTFNSWPRIACKKNNTFLFGKHFVYMVVNTLRVVNTYMNI